MEMLRSWISIIAYRIPWNVVVPTIAFVAISIVLVLIFIRSHRRLFISIICTMGYMCLLLYATYFNRTPGAEIQYDFVPFWSLGKIIEGHYDVLYEKFVNVLLFIPFGFFVSFYPIRHRRIFFVCLIAAITSISIELLQLITKTGMCETDDVICNTFGCAIGGNDRSWYL